MLNTAFEDAIVNATDLRKNQKRWFELAYRKPVTVKFRTGGLAIMNRELVRNLYKATTYTEMAIRFCTERVNPSTQESAVFPWLGSLNIKEKEEFHLKFLDLVLKAFDDDNWSTVEEFLEDWKATADAKSNSVLLKVWRKKGKPEEYVALDEQE